MTKQRGVETVTNKWGKIVSKKASEAAKKRWKQNSALRKSFDQNRADVFKKKKKKK